MKLYNGVDGDGSGIISKMPIKRFFSLVRNVSTCTIISTYC